MAMVQVDDDPRELTIRHIIMPLVGICTVIGIGVAEIMTLPPGPPIALTLAFLVSFLGLLLLHNFRRSGRPGNIALSSAQTALTVGIMLVGSSPMIGSILFFILCTKVAMEQSLALALSWDFLASISLYGCILAKGQGHEVGISALLVSLGFFAMTALSVSLRLAQESRKKSLRLLEELSDAQSRLSELAVLEERQRLAGEIHDAVGYRLTASAMLLESAARLVPADPDRAVRLIETSRDQVREGLAELRTAVHALREDKADKLPLEGILQALVDVFSQSVEAQVSLHIREGLPEPDTDRKLVLVRTAQEALTNAQKHSGASRIELRLRFEDGVYSFECRDDGRGLGALNAPRSPVAAYGFGLGNLRARAAAFGGNAELLSAEGGGALLRLRLPARKEDGDGSRSG
jgi:signal transduction histidine kinase